jgi:hypothetical protein
MLADYHPTVELSQYNDRAFDLVQQHIEWCQPKACRNYATWCEYHVYIARKSKQIDLALRNAHLFAKLAMGGHTMAEQETSTELAQAALYISGIRFLTEAGSLRLLKDKQIIHGK